MVRWQIVAPGVAKAGGNQCPPGCAAPSRIWESDLSRRSWRSGGAAAAADSHGSGHLSSLSLTQTSQLQLSSIAIGLTQRAGTSGERRAHWLRGARRSCSDYHISAPAPPRATARSASPQERIKPPEATSLPGRRVARVPGRRLLLVHHPLPAPPRTRRVVSWGSSAVGSPGPRGPLAALSSGLPFLPPVASSWWVGPSCEPGPYRAPGKRGNLEPAAFLHWLPAWRAQPWARRCLRKGCISRS